MNKKINILFIMILFFICTTKIKAYYTSSSGTSWNINTVDCSGDNCYSSKNSGKLILQARLYYIDNASFTQVGETYYFVNISAYNSNDLKGINKIYIETFNGYNGDNKYTLASNYLKSYFNNKTNVEDYLKKVTGTTNYSKVLTKLSDTNKGYRIMIEPAMIFGNPSFFNGNIALMTPKGLAQEKVITGILPSNISLIGNNSMAQYLYMTNSELGIRVNNDEYSNSKDYCASLNYKKLGDIKIGCGYNLINISNYINVKCYRMNVTGDNLKCINYDKNNEGEYQETYTELSSCTNQATADQNKAYGKLYTTSGTCKIYCKETGKISLPGNILTPVQRGSYFAWPTKSKDKTGKYKLTMSTNLSCKITDTGGSTSVVASNFTRSCQAGYTSYNDDCRSITQTSKICPSGTTEIDGGCYTTVKSTNRSPRTIETTDKVCDTANGYNPTGQSGNNACKKQVDTNYIYGCPTGYSGQHEHVSNNIVDEPSRCCPDGYRNNINTTAGNSNSCKSEDKLFTGEYKCPNGEIRDDSNCSANKYSTQEYKCPNGGSVSGSLCIKNKDKKCTKPWGNYGSGGYQCSMSATLTTVYKCPNGYSSSGASSCTANGTPQYDYLLKADAAMIIIRTEKVYDFKAKVCPSSHPLNSSTGKCEKKIEPTCDGKGTLTTIDGKQVCAVCPSGYTYYKDGTCRSTTSYNKVCPWNDGKKYVLINDVCYQRTSDSDTDYKCPANYNISSNNRNCTKVCNKETLKNTVDNILKEEKTEIKLTGGTNKKIDEYLKSEVLNQNYDKDKLQYNKTTSFYIDSNKNRYYNKLTGEVSDENNNNKTIFDRQQGVISLSKDDNVLENNLIKKYELKLQIENFGIDNQFGSKISNYVCHYTLTDTPECRCPQGTKNEGDLVSELNKKICNANSDSCTEMQNKLCNYDFSTTKLENCNETYSCTKNNSKIDITDCIKEKIKENTLGDSIYMCELENECDNNKCEGDCKETSKKIDNIIYQTSICNDQYCNFNVNCSDTNKQTSQSSYDCIKRKLNTDNILETLNNGITLDKLESAIKSCKTIICSSDEKIIFRVIDLENPFPGKNNNEKNTEFSITGKGRTPGYNWNSITVVKKQILKARGVDGYKIYNKEPLYKITLTPNMIKQIREYNKNNSYDDFKLKCNNDKSECISYFLHSQTEVNLNIEGVSSCKNLNLRSTKEDFDKCYNSNN